MLKFVLVAGLVGTVSWAAPVKDVLVPRQDGPFLGDGALELPNLVEDSKIWTAFYCEGPNYKGPCITQQYSNGECTPVEPPLCNNVLSFLASSSNCVLYEGDDCTGSAIPIYSSVQDLRAFRKTNSYRCGLSSALAATQLASPPSTPVSQSPAPAPRVSPIYIAAEADIPDPSSPVAKAKHHDTLYMTKTETDTVTLEQTATETSIVDGYESLHAAAVTSTVEIIPPASEATTSSTDGTSSAATAEGTASSAPTPFHASSVQPYHRHRRPKYITVTETATHVVDAYVAAMSTSATAVGGSASVAIPIPAETNEATPSSTRTTNGAATSAQPHHHHHRPKYLTVTETATRIINAYVTPSTTHPKQDGHKVLVAPEIPAVSTSSPAQPFPLAGSSVGHSASRTVQIPVEASLSTAPSPTSVIPSAPDVLDAAVSTASLPDTLASSPSASVISLSESINHPAVSVEGNIVQTTSPSKSVVITHASAVSHSPSEGTEAVTGHHTKSLVGEAQGVSAVPEAPAPTQVYDKSPSAASLAIPEPLPLTSTTPIAGKQGTVLPFVEHTSTVGIPLASSPTPSVLAESEGHGGTTGVTPVQTDSSLPAPTPEATERPPSSRAPNSHADVAFSPAVHHNSKAHERLPTSQVLSPTSVLVSNEYHAPTIARTPSAVISHTTASVGTPVSALPLAAFSDNVAPSILASTSITSASTDAPIPVAGNTGISSVHAVLANDQVHEDVKTVVVHQTPTLTIISISTTTSTRQNGRLGGSSDEDSPSPPLADSSTATANVPNTSPPGTLPGEPAPPDIDGSVHAASITTFPSSLRGPLPIPSSMEIPHVAEDAGRAYQGATPSSLAAPSASRMQTLEDESSATVTVGRTTTLHASSSLLPGQPSTSTVKHAPSFATGANVVAAQIPSLHTSSTHLTDPAATPPPRFPEDEVLATMTIHRVTSLGTASIHDASTLAGALFPTSISVGSTSNPPPSAKEEGTGKVVFGASSSSSTPSSIGSPTVTRPTQATYGAPSAASSLWSIHSVASHTDDDGVNVAPVTVSQTISGYSTPAAQSASVVPPFTPVVHSTIEAHVPKAFLGASPTENPASLPTPTKTTQPEDEIVTVTVRRTTLLGSVSTSTTVQPSVTEVSTLATPVLPSVSDVRIGHTSGYAPSVISIAGLLPTVNPSESSATLVNDGGGLPSTSPSDNGSVDIAHPTPTGTAGITSHPLSLLSPLSEGHAIDKGPGYATIHETTSLGPVHASSETPPGSVQATPTLVSHPTSHQSHATDDEGIAYVTITSSTLIAPPAAALTTITELPSEPIAMGNHRHVTNADRTSSAPIVVEGTTVHQTTSITASPTPLVSDALFAPSRVQEGLTRLEATEVVQPTKPLPPVVTSTSTSTSSSISTGPSTANPTDGEKAVLSHKATSQASPEAGHRAQESSTVFTRTHQATASSGLPPSVHELAPTTTKYFGTTLPPVTPTNPTSLLLTTHAVDNDDGLVYITVHRTTGSVPTTTSISVFSSITEESGKTFATGATSTSSSIASPTAYGTHGEGSAYVTSRTTNSAGLTPTGAISEVPTAPLSSTTVSIAVLAVSGPSIARDATTYTTIQQSITVAPTTISGTLSMTVLDQGSVTSRTTTTLPGPSHPVISDIQSATSLSPAVDAFATDSYTRSITVTSLLASASPVPHVVDNEGLAYVTIHHTRSLDASLAPPFASASSVVSPDAELPGITSLPVSTIVPPTPRPADVAPTMHNADKESLAYVTDHRKKTLTSVDVVPSQAGGSLGLPIPAATHSPSTVVLHNVDTDVYSTVQLTKTTGAVPTPSVIVTSSIGAPTGVEGHDLGYVTVHQTKTLDAVPPTTGAASSGSYGSDNPTSTRIRTASSETQESGNPSTMSPVTHGVDDEGLTYITVHHTKALGAPSVSTPPATISAALPGAAATPSEKAIAPPKNDSADISSSTLTPPNATANGTGSRDGAFSSTGQGEKTASVNPTTSVRTTPDASASLSHHVLSVTQGSVKKEGLITAHDRGTPTATHDSYLESSGPPEGTSSYGSTDIAATPPKSTILLTIIAENTGDSDDITVPLPTSTLSISTPPYVSTDWTGSVASETVTEHVEATKLSVAKLGTSVRTTPAVSTAQASSDHVLSATQQSQSVRERFTTIRYAATRTATSTTFASYASTSIATAAPTKPAGSKTVVAENTGDSDDIPVLPPTSTFAISTPPYVSAGGNGTGTTGVESTVVKPTTSDGRTLAAASITSPTKAATSDRAPASSGLPGGTLSYTSVGIVVAPPKSTGTKTIVAEATDDLNDIPVLPPTSTLAISTPLYASANGLGTGAYKTGQAEVTESVVVKPATSVETTPIAASAIPQTKSTASNHVVAITQGSAEKGGLTNTHHAGTPTTTHVASFVSSSGLPGSAYTSTYVAAASIESTRTRTILAGSTGDSDDIPVLPYPTSPILSHTAPPSESTIVATIIAQNADDSDDIPALPHATSTVPTVSLPSQPVPIVSVPQTTPVDTASPYVSAPTTTDADTQYPPLSTETTSTGIKDSQPAPPEEATPASVSSLASSVQGTQHASSVLDTATTTTHTSSTIIDAQIGPSILETASILSSSPASTSTKGIQHDSPVASTFASSVKGIHTTSSTPEAAPVLSSPTVTVSIKDTQYPSPTSTIIQSNLPSVTATPTSLPSAASNESQNAPSRLETASTPNSSSAHPSVKYHSEHEHPSHTENLSTQSISSVLVTLTPTSSSAALLETVSIPISSPVTASTEDHHHASPVVLIPTYSTPLSSSVEGIRPTSSGIEAAPAPSSFPLTTGTEDTQFLSPTPTGVQSTVTSVPKSTTPTSSPAATTKESQNASSFVDTASILNSSSATTSTKYSQHAILVVTPTPTPLLASSIESIYHASSLEAAPVPSSSHTIVSVKDTQSPAPAETATISIEVSHTPTPTSSPAAATKDSQNVSSIIETAPTPSSLPVVASMKYHSVHPTTVETLSTQSISSVLVTGTPISLPAAATISASSLLETTSSPSPVPAATSFEDLPASTVSTHASAPTGASVKDTNSQRNTLIAQSTPAAPTTTPTPAITTRSDTIPTHTHHHDHDMEEEEIVYVTIITTTTVTQPVCTTTTYPTETVTQTIMARRGLEVAQPTGVPNGQ